MDRQTGFYIERGELRAKLDPTKFGYSVTFQRCDGGTWEQLSSVHQQELATLTGLTAASQRFIDALLRRHAGVEG